KFYLCVPVLYTWIVHNDDEHIKLEEVVSWCNSYLTTFNEEGQFRTHNIAKCGL
ncbi:hypothetical protein MIMGU_mgv1a0213982mg, partial [Erythranthe guttata]